MFHIARIEFRLLAMGAVFVAMIAGCSGSDTVSSKEEATQSEPVTHVSSRPILSIQVRQDKDDASKRFADIVFEKPKNTDGPRVAEIVLKHSDGLKYLSSTAGTALGDSKKTLVAQEKENNTLRLVMYGADNVNTIGGGILATIEYESDTTKPNRLEILTNGPIFAPGVANDGLLVTDPVTFE